MAALNAAKILLDKGLKADNYSGGLQEWLQAGLPTVGTDDPQKPAKTPCLNP